MTRPTTIQKPICSIVWNAMSWWDAIGALASLSRSSRESKVLGLVHAGSPALTGWRMRHTGPFLDFPPTHREVHFSSLWRYRVISAATGRSEPRGQRVTKAVVGAFTDPRDVSVR